MKGSQVRCGGADQSPPTGSMEGDRKGAVVATNGGGNQSPSQRAWATVEVLSTELPTWIAPSSTVTTLMQFCWPRTVPGWHWGVTRSSSAAER